MLEEKEEELRKYTYEPVDNSLGRIMAYRPDTIFPSMVTLQPKSKQLRRQQLCFEAKEVYFAVALAEQQIKEYERQFGGCDSDGSNSDCNSDNDFKHCLASPRSFCFASLFFASLCLTYLSRSFLFVSFCFALLICFSLFVQCTQEM